MCVCGMGGVCGVLCAVCVVFYGVLGVLLRLNPMFPTVTQLFVVDVVGHVAEQIHGW